VPSSEMAMKALAIPAARAPEPVRLKTSPTCAAAPDAPASMMLQGFRSRWTTPLLCARSSASAIWTTTRAAKRGSAAPSRRMNV